MIFTYQNTSVIIQLKFIVGDRVMEEFYIAQGISVVTTAVSVVSTQIKSMKAILICKILANLLSVATYLLLGGISAAGMCFVAIFHSVVSFIFNAKNKKPPIFVAILFMAMYIACSAIYYKSPVDLISAAAAICFCISLTQNNSTAYRFWFVFNPLLWIVYDILMMAYGNVVMHGIVLVSTVVAIIRLDICGSKNQKKQNLVKQKEKVNEK